MRIPEHALDILSEVTIRAEELMNHMGEQASSSRSVDQQHARLKAEKSLYGLLESLGCIWVGIPPYVYSCVVFKRGEKREIEYFLTHADSYADAETEEIPRELYDVLKHFHDDHWRDEKPIDPRYVHDRITALANRLAESSKHCTRVRRPRKSPSISKDYQIIRCAKGEYSFTEFQAQVIRKYWDNYIKGNHWLKDEDAMTSDDVSGSDIHGLFKSRKDEFKAIFEQHPKERHLYRLNLD